jgi:pyruvate carboxylase
MGGGGRGMRVVRDQASFKENFERAVSEAKSAFGDGTVFIERMYTLRVVSWVLMSRVP